MENMHMIREQFPITKNKVFLNHAAQSPLPKPVADAVRRFADDFSNFGTTSIEWNDGWASVKPEVFDTIDFWDIWSLRLSETASRFEVGSPSFISLTGATEALKMVLNFGIENIQKRILKLTDHLIESVKSLGFKLQTPEEPQCRSGVVNFKIDKPKETAESLNRKGIIVSARAHGLRVSPHFYNTEEEIDKFMEEIKNGQK